MFRYILNSAIHYRRINVVVLAAMIISTAVIGGSLIVGDSVRYSLRQMTLQRLGQITHILHAPTFFRQDLAAEIQQTAADSRVAPALLLTGSVEVNDGESIRRAGSVTILGMTAAGWNLLETADTQPPTDRSVVLGYRTAQELQVDVGDQVSMWVELPSSVPRDSLLGERDETTLEIVLTVGEVLSETTGASRFALTAGQQLPFNAFVDLQTLQSVMGLEQVEASRRSPVAKPARINAMLAAMPGSAADSTPAAETAVAAPRNALTAGLKDQLTLADLGLRLRTISDRGYISAESERMIIEDSLADAILSAADELGLQTEPSLVYLANEIFAADRQSDQERYSMYSIVAGLPFQDAPAAAPYRLQDGDPPPELGNRDILLSDWLQQDLEVAVGDRVGIRWHAVGSHGELPEIERTFTVRGMFPADDPQTVDQNLTPVVEGITDVDTFGDWNQPFEMQMGRITDRDDEYWSLHRATPKAFLSLDAAEELWSSRFGSYTSIRVAPDSQPGSVSEQQLQSIQDRLGFEILQQVDPAAAGLYFRPVLAEGLQAAVGANDFTQLFIGFSFFLILSAIILASLMFKLGIRQRISQLGLLQAVGWPNGRVRRFFLAEGLLVAAAGSVLGAAAAVGFAKLMIYGLTTWWVGAIGTQFLLLDVQPLRLVIAAGTSLLLAAVVIWLAVWSYRRVPVRELLNGSAGDADDPSGHPDSWWNRLVTLGGRTALLLAVGIPAAVIAEIIPDGEAFAGLTWKIVCFFIAGFACLSAGLYILRNRVQRRNAAQDAITRTLGFVGLAFANAARSPQRSLLTTALIAFATFVIVAVGAGRRNPLSETPDIKSGNGGFTLVAETAQPVLFDLNTAAGRRQLGFGSGDQPQLPPETTIYSFAMKPGQDASCVNLYQTQVPTLLGASPDFLQRGGFRFADTKGENPWLQLQQPLPDQNGLPVIPVIGDMNTLQFSLKKGMGDLILVPNDQVPEFALQVVGMLDGSVLQGVLVLSADHLRRIDPQISGSRYFLVELKDPAQDVDQAAAALESNLNPFGMDTELVANRLAGFLAVQNTYLSTFQMLGGLGLLVGTFGLAAVMMRNVIERRREIALMRAVGFTTWRVCLAIVFENGLLLFWGIGLGTVSALLAMLPHLLSTGADVPWQPLGLTLAAVAVIGSLASVFAVRRAATVSIRENLATE